MVATLVEEMKPVVADKHDFECRNSSKIKACFGFFGKSRLRYEEKINDLTYQPNFFLKFQAFGRYQDGRFQAPTHGEVKVSK